MASGRTGQRGKIRTASKRAGRKTSGKPRAKGVRKKPATRGRRADGAKTARKAAKTPARRRTAATARRKKASVSRRSPARATQPRGRKKGTGGGKAAPARKPAARKSIPTVADLERRVRSLRSEKSRLHGRLSEMVQEIGFLRQYELRTRMLERQLAERDGEIASLKARLGEPVESGSAAG